MGLSLKNLPSCVKRFPLLSILIVYEFVASGLFITLLCLLCVLFIWPFSKDLYRFVAQRLAFFLIGQLVWVSVDWADTQVTLFGDDSAFETFGKNNCLMSVSHRGEFDWVIGFIVCAYFGCLETVKTLPKNSVKYVPGFGQLLWALEFPFMSRNWQKDGPNIAKTLQTYINYPFPIQVCIFCEGSRFSVKKLKEGQEYAKEKGLRPLKYHLLPRTKGYAIVAKCFKEANVEEVYDVGMAYPLGQKFINGSRMGFPDIICGQKIEVFFYLRKFKMGDLPSEIEGLQSFCHQLYIDKDEAYDYFVKNGTYPVKSRPLEFSKKQMRSLRINQLFWFVFVVTIPSCVLTWYLLTCASFSMVVYTIVSLLAGGVLLTKGMLMYVRQSKSARSDD